MNTSSSTFGTLSGESLTKEKILDAMAKLKAIPKNDNWIVVDPAGNVSIGKFEQVFPVMMQHHPLLKPIGLLDPIDPSFGYERG